MVLHFSQWYPCRTWSEYAPANEGSERRGWPEGWRTSCPQQCRSHESMFPVGTTTPLLISDGDDHAVWTPAAIIKLEPNAPPVQGSRHLTLNMLLPETNSWTGFHYEQRWGEILVNSARIWWVMCRRESRLGWAFGLDVAQFHKAQTTEMLEDPSYWKHRETSNKVWPFDSSQKKKKKK